MDKCEHYILETKICKKFNINMSKVDGGEKDCEWYWPESNYCGLKNVKLKLREDKNDI